jgi:DNA repair protein RadC
LDSPEAVAALAQDLVGQADDDREHFWLVLLNAQNRLLLIHEVSTGSQSASIVHPREVLGPALREGAAHLVLIHNHPSGEPTPSKEDVHLTRQLVEGCRLVGLRLHDHLVIGSGTGDWVSLAQRGLI